VGIDKAFVDYSANCGNISSAVGPYAVDTGLVKAVEPFTVVRIYEYQYEEDDSCKESRLKREVHPGWRLRNRRMSRGRGQNRAEFMDPAELRRGTSRLPGMWWTELTLESGSGMPSPIVDAGNPTAFIRAGELSLRGDELPADFDKDTATRAKLEAIRRRVAELTGIPVSQSLPKNFLHRPRADFRTATGEMVGKESVSMLGPSDAMGKMHKAFAITAGIPAAIGAVIRAPWSIAW